MATTTTSSVDDSAIEAQAATFFEAIRNSIYRGSGFGAADASFMMALSRVDRYGINTVPLNSEHPGYTFITRPKLNLDMSNLGGDRILSCLRTNDPDSWMFSIRALLDTKYARSTAVSSLVRNSPWINSDLPFILPLTNMLTSISGFPDISLDTETTDGGYYGEDLTFVRGGDMNYGTHDLTLTFNDIQGGYLMSLFLVWIHWMRLVTRGLVTPYMEDVFYNRLCYTCSIYRFVMDPSRRYIVKWCKATGCMPTSVPIGNSFNIDDRNHFVEASRQFTVPFKANVVEINDPIIFQEFNTIVSRYAGPGSGIPTNTVADSPWLNGRILVPVGASYNYCGLPYIDVAGGRNELQFYALQEELEDQSDAALDKILAQVNAQSSTISNYEALAGLVTTDGTILDV